MKKYLLKAIAIVAAMGFCSTNAMAADPDLANDYTLVRSITFSGDTVITLGTSAIAYTAYETGNAKQQQLYDCTAPESASGWIAFQGTGSKGWLNRSGYGLWCYNATRSAAVYEPTLTTGYLVVFTCTQDPSKVITLTNASGDPDGTFSYVKSEDGKSYICTINAKENAYVGFCGVKTVGYITNISVYKPNKTVVEAKYKVAYVDGDKNVLKDTVEYNGIAGNKVSLSEADKANISYEGNTYLYSSDNSADVTIAEDGSSVATVTFRKAANFTYTVKEVYGDVVLRETTGTSYESASVTVPYRKYNTYEGKLYTKGATDKEYNHKFKLTADNQVETLSYDEVAGVENVVFLTEGEDIEGMTACTTANTGIRSSNSSSAYASEDVKIANLDNGTYKMHAVIYDASKEPNSNWKFYLNDATQTEAGNFTCTIVNLEEFESEFAVKSSTDLMFSAAGSASMGIDMIYIVKTGKYKYLDVESTLPDTLSYVKGTPEDEKPKLSDYIKVSTNAIETGAIFYTAKVEAGADKAAVTYTDYLSEDAAKAAMSEPGLYYCFGRIVGAFSMIDLNDYKEAYTDTIVVEVKEAEAEPVSAHTWDFTQWSDATITNLKADAAASKISGWSDVEKKADAEAGVDPTELSKDNCFWFAGEANADGQLEANGVVIEELKGITFPTTAYNSARSIAIAVNYQLANADLTKAFGPYNGASYFWLGGKEKDCFVINNVKAGTEIKMGVESHKITDARGVKLYVKNGESRVELKGTDGEAVAAPTVYADQTWVVTSGAATAKGTSLSANVAAEELVDVIVYNTNGCHIYYIDAEIGELTPDAIQTVEAETEAVKAVKFIKDGKLIIVSGGKQFNAAGALVK